MREKLRVAWFSPLSQSGASSESKSAYFTESTLPLLRQRFEIELFAAQESSNEVSSNFLTAYRRHREKPFDLFLYQVEQGRHSHFTRMHLALMPGLVLFHDFLFTDSGPESLVESEWCEKLYGAELDWLKSPIGFREGGLAVLALFSDARMHDEFRRSVGGALRQSAGLKAADSFYLPLPVTPAMPLAANPTEGKIVYCGTPQIEDRAHKFLQALARLKGPYKLVWLAAEKERAQAAQLLREFSVKDAEIVTSRSPKRWSEILEGAALAVHTHFSAYGQLGPYLQISLMRGVPCLITRFGAAEFVPDRLVFKVDAGNTEAWQIEQVLDSMLQGRVELDRNALRAYAEQNFAAKRVAGELGNVFEEFSPVLSRALKRADKRVETAKLEVTARARSGTLPLYFDRNHPERVLGDEFVWREVMAAAFSEFGWGG